MNPALGGDLHYPLQGDAVAGHDHAVVFPAMVHGAVIMAFRRRLRARHGGVLDGPGHSLFMGMVEGAGERSGFGHLVPHGGRETVPDVGELIAPEAGPGHAAQEQQQQETRPPEADHGVQIAPPEASALVHSGPEDAPYAGSLARPPQVEPADEQHYAPAGGQFDQPIPCGAEQQLRMQGTGHRLQVPLVVHGAEQGAAGGIHEEGQLALALVDNELGTRVGGHGGQVFAQAGIWHGDLRLGQQLIGAQGLGGGGHLHQLGVEQVVELGLVQVQDAGEGEQDQKGGDEETGIEMPAPDPLVITRVLILHL
ncbi:hypothetical protein D3C72_929030 [compost metagenome]